MPAQFLHGVELIELTSGSRPIQTVQSAVIGIIGTAPFADPVSFPLDTPVLIYGSRADAAKLISNYTTGDVGTLPQAVDAILDQAGALIVVVRVSKGATDTETQTNVLGSVDASTGNYKGLLAFVAAESKVGVVPRVLIAPGFTHQRTTVANPVTAKLLTVANRLRAVVIADAPNTNDADAITYAGDFGDSRVYLVDPFIIRPNIVGGGTSAQPTSACAAGIIARVDNDEGFWCSLSNKLINGIVGTARPIDFALNDPACRANQLNAAKVGTVVRQNGFRLWGNRSLSSDQNWAFLSVRRTADMINDSLVRNHLWAVDRGINKQYLKDVADGVNAYLRSLKTQGAIINGKCWAADSGLNSPANLSSGMAYFDFDFVPPMPAEHIVFRSYMNKDYLSEVL